MRKSWKNTFSIGLIFFIFLSFLPTAMAKSPVFGSRYLALGSYGDDVKVLQTILKAEGYYREIISPSFDLSTAQTVKSYQKNHNLKADGVVGKQTYQKLNQVNSSNYEELKKEILALTKNKKGVYGVYLKDLKTGQVLQINGDLPFTAASTYKVPLNLYLYEKILKGEVDPNTELQYQAGDYEEGTGILQGKPIGSYFKIKDLAELSITVSDNVAKNMLERYLGGRPEVIKYMASLGGQVQPNQKKLASPLDLSLYLEKALTMAKNHPEVTGKFIDDLKHTAFNDRINALLPSNVEVAHKIGNQVNVLNDTAIVFHKQRPYLLTIMSENISYSEAYPTIQAISKKIYDFQNSLR